MYTTVNYIPVPLLFIPIIQPFIIILIIFCIIYYICSKLLILNQLWEFMHCCHTTHSSHPQSLPPITPFHHSHHSHIIISCHLEIFQRNPTPLIIFYPPYICYICDDTFYKIPLPLSFIAVVLTFSPYFLLPSPYYPLPLALFLTTFPAQFSSE